MTEHHPQLYLTHILESADLVASYVRGLDLVEFAKDQQLQDAVVRRIAGMRDKVIHDYMGVDIELVWAVAETLMPQLRSEVSRILEDLDPAGGIA